LIRAIWVALVMLVTTPILTVIVVGAAMLKVRGGIYMWITRTWSQIFLWACAVRVTIEGMEHVAPGQPRIIVSNHLSWIDIVAIAANLPGTFHFIGKKELDRIPFFGRAWRAAGHISIDRSNREHAYQGLKRAGEQMRREGSLVVIFAEGTRSRTGRLQPFKRGAFSLAAETGVPIVPTVVQGSFEIMPPDKVVIRPRPVLVRFLPPLPTVGQSSEELALRVRGVMLDALGENELPDGTPA
jgi:1-acyl-sn-glycerol-3-phosphate acyltransferase